MIQRKQNMDSRIVLVALVSLFLFSSASEVSKPGAIVKAYRSCNCNSQEEWRREQCDDYACMTCNMLGSETEYTFADMGKMYRATPEKARHLLVKKLCKTVFKTRISPELRVQCTSFMKEFLERNDDFVKAHNVMREYKEQLFREHRANALKAKREEEGNPEMVVSRSYVHNKASKTDVGVGIALNAWANFEACVLAKCCKPHHHIFPNDINFQYEYTTDAEVAASGRHTKEEL